MEITGRVNTIGGVQTFGNSFQKRELILTTEEQYPQDIVIEFLQMNCVLLDKVQEGQLIRVEIALRGREWKSPSGEIKYFNSVVGSKIETLEEGQPAHKEESSKIPPLQMGANGMPVGSNFIKVDLPTQDSEKQNTEDDDLPF